MGAERRTGVVAAGRREQLLMDVCTAGRDDDASVHDVTLAVLASWLAAFVPGVAPAVSPSNALSVTSSAPGGGASGAPITTAVTGMGRASGSYLLVARRTGETCAALIPPAPMQPAALASRGLLFTLTTKPRTCSVSRQK